MHGTQATSALFNSIDKRFKQSKEQIILLADTVDSFLWLLSPTTECFATFAGVAACLFYAACRSTVLCTCACAADTLYNHVSHPKACTEGAVASSAFSHAVKLCIFCSAGCRGRGAAQSCACMTYTSQFEHEYESSFVLLSYFRMNDEYSKFRSFVSPLLNRHCPGAELGTSLQWFPNGFVKYFKIFTTQITMTMYYYTAFPHKVVRMNLQG